MHPRTCTTASVSTRSAGELWRPPRRIVRVYGLPRPRTHTNPETRFDEPSRATMCTVHQEPATAQLNARQPVAYPANPAFDAHLADRSAWTEISLPGWDGVSFRQAASVSADATTEGHEPQPGRPGLRPEQEKGRAGERRGQSKATKGGRRQPRQALHEAGGQAESCDGRFTHGPNRALGSRGKIVHDAFPASSRGGSDADVGRSGVVGGAAQP